MTSRNGVDSGREMVLNDAMDKTIIEQAQERVIRAQLAVDAAVPHSTDAQDQEAEESQDAWSQLCDELGICVVLQCGKPSMPDHVACGGHRGWWPK